MHGKGQLMELCRMSSDLMVEANKWLFTKCIDLTITFQAKHYYVRSRYIPNSTANTNNNGRTKYDPSMLMTFYRRTIG
jgi:hypothetical protein